MPNCEEWIKTRSIDELLQHYALLRHLPQIDYSGHARRAMIKDELQVRALRLSQFMASLDKNE